MAALKTLLLSLVFLVPVLIGIVWKLTGEGFAADDNGRKVKCESRNFILPGMPHCRPNLSCKEISEQVTVKEIIGKGAVKLVRRGVWLNYSVAVNTLANPDYRADFHHGLHMLRQLQSSVSITQLVGECQHLDVFLTQFHPVGSADRLEETLKKPHLRGFNTLSRRFSLCEDYVRILHELHNSRDGARVMCDSNDVNKTLSQFLIGEDLSLVLNDVDALPLVNRTQGQLVKCGHRELFGEFVAPEQLWPYDDQDFDDSLMPGYDEKVDIWKVPDVCEALLGQVQGSGKVRLQLIMIHLKCKSMDPSQRPAASELVEEYRNIRGKLEL